MLRASGWGLCKRMFLIMTKMESSLKTCGNQKEPSETHSVMRIISLKNLIGLKGKMKVNECVTVRKFLFPK